MRRSIINKIIVGTLVFTGVSCTGDYMDINSNPYQPGTDDMQADDYMLGSAMNNLSSCVVSSDVNTAQFTDCLLGGPMGGYFSDTNTGWGNTIGNFNATDNWTNVFLKSDKLIPQLFTNLTSVQNISEKTDNPVPFAIAKIIKVAAMSRVTDTYGPIPYSKIGLDGAVTTPYDSQEVVYKQFFTELDEAIATLNDNPGAALAATADYVYSGNINKWILFANSLRLRLAMRIVYANQTLAEQEAQKAIQGGVIESNNDNAKWSYFGSIVNPLYTATRYNSATDHACLTGGDTHAAADIICYMNGYNDPRRSKYFVPSEWTGYEYVGVRRSINRSTLGVDAHKYSGVNVGQSDPIMWMNAAEITFLRAEGALRGWNMGGEAKDLYNQAIALSFEQWGVTEANTYAANTTDMPLIYTDAVYYMYDDTAGPRSTITIAWEDGAENFERNLERIITQKWIANFPLGVESWSEFRRTGYPRLIPVVENKSGGIIDTNHMIRRLWYPPTEYTENADNINLAIGLLGGPDNGGTRLWWDKKPFQ